MKRMLAFTAFMITIFAAYAYPASGDKNGNENLNKEDVSINFINGNQPTTASAVDAEKNKNTVQPNVSVSVGGTFGLNIPGEDGNTPRPIFPPPPPPPPQKNVFSRLIDDIFQRRDVIKTLKTEKKLVEMDE